MYQRSKSVRRITFLMLWIFGCTSVIVPTAHAGMISSERYQAQADPAEQSSRMEVQVFLQREDVRQQLVALGVDPEQASQRVAALSDAELAPLAKLVEQPAGGNVVGAIVFIFLVLLITDILGLTDVFTFVKKR